ncbi:MAG TPA: bifunctional adenosylcobinamide kinase/adenosylcobinamide-phosphate guanylyltransferase [Polyangiaceae bacterium]|nr:bifunctional adenosylcobinamide kinase/adenosylcobinamide-phosphate guanylyltransferase [Polyangiaceae bacterium]
MSLSAWEPTEPGGLSLVGGGVRSGKSRFALDLARSRSGRRAFVATAEPFDDEMRSRIDRHVVERGGDFFTIEAGYALEDAIGALRGNADVVVVDCLTLWISNLLVSGLEGPRIEARVSDLARLLEEGPFSSIVVTNEVGMGIVPRDGTRKALP